MRKFLTRSDKLYIGNKPIKVEKITIAKWRKLFEVIETLPQLIIDVLTAPQTERTAYFVIALERSFDEIVNIVSVLTGIDAKYIEDNASIDELIAYFTEVAKVNDFNSVVKNVQSVLSLVSRKETETAESQDAK